MENTCFKGPDAAADVATFFSMNIIIGRFAAIMDATMNSRTGKRFFKAPKTGAVSSKGRTRNPVTGQVLDNKEPESAGMSNPMYDFDFAGAWDDFTPTTASDECSKCFTCKVFLATLKPTYTIRITDRNLAVFLTPTRYQSCVSSGGWWRPLRV